MSAISLSTALNTAIYAISVILIIAVAVCVPIVIFCPEKSFYKGYFRLWRRLHAKWRGRFDYSLYTLKYSLKTSPLTKIPAGIWYLQRKIFFWLPFLFPAIMILFYKVHNLFSEFWFIVSVVFFCIDFYNNNSTEKLNAQYTEVRISPEAYKNVRVDDESCLLDFGYSGSVCVNSRVNEWLLAAKNIGLRYCEDYENGLRSQICSKRNWENIYLPFLQNNYKKSNHTGSQFVNESKFGISCGLDPGKDYVEVHKTCYFDSYLTNIIPGMELVRSVDGEITAGTENFLPYERDHVLLGSNGDVLRGIYRANEPGISTLLILPDGRVLFWRQNNFAMSSAGKIAPSGSGSADWDDCKNFLGEPDGFRKAIIHAMERELWEESYSSGGRISPEDFMKNTETRIIGHFRWLQKSGKYEFVGVTRFLDELPGCNAPQPCSMEVIQGDSPQISTVGDAKRTFPAQDSLPGFTGIISQTKTHSKPSVRDDGGMAIRVVKETTTTEETEVKTVSDAVNLSRSKPGSFIEIKDYSVPCVMAVLYLRQLCSDYCEKCPAKTECFSGNIRCSVKLEEAIFVGHD